MHIKKVSVLILLLVTLNTVSMERISLYKNNQHLQSMVTANTKPHTSIITDVIRSKNLEGIKILVEKANIPLDRHIDYSENSPKTITDGSITVEKLYYTPLHLAAKFNAPEIIEYLITKGANPNVIEPTTGKTPLHNALGASAYAAMIELIKHNADPNIKDKEGISPFALAQKINDKKYIIMFEKINCAK
jgi:ankyrin repeat protein